MNDSKSTNPFHKPQLLRMKFHTGYVRFVPAAYNNGNKALQMIDAKTGEPICRPSINLGHEVGSTEMAIKAHDENEGVWEFLSTIGFIEQTALRIERSGYSEYPIARLTDAAMGFYDDMKSRDLKLEFAKADLQQSLTESLVEAADLVARVVVVAEEIGTTPERKRAGARKALKAFFALYRANLLYAREEMAERRRLADTVKGAVASMKNGG